MPGTRRSLLAISLATACAVTLAGCGSSESSAGAGAAGGTVSVDVGNGQVHVPKTGLRLGILFNGQSNAWQIKVAKRAKEKAESLGWKATILDANFDYATQLNQLQTAATSHSFDAVIVVPIDDGECKAITQTLPKAGVLVTVLSAPVCNRAMAAGDDLWVPGTLNYVGGDTSASYYKAWFESAAALNPGRQKVAVVIGPELSPFTLVQKAVATEFQKSHPDFAIADYVYTDYTTPTGYSSTLSYLRAHPDTTVVISVYTPDLTRGVVRAVDAAGMTGKVSIVDIGGSGYTVEQIKQGTVQSTLGFFPNEDADYAVQGIQDAVAGKAPVRFVSVVPKQYGTVDKPLMINKSNIASFTPEY